ncbi:MAG: DUF4070 domain-containing protein, partial [bacterium]
VGRERGQYWRLFFWTLAHRPKSFAQAITFAIYGFHFRRVFQLHVQKGHLPPANMAGSRLQA